MTKEKESLPMRTAAWVAGLALFFPVAPYAEFYVFKKLILYQDAAQTTENLINHPQLFLSGIFAIFLMYLYDIVLAWALYIFLAPVNKWLSLLAAWFRIVYTGLAMVALFNFVYAFQLVSMPDFREIAGSEQVGQLVNARRFGMHFAYIVFGIYLILIGTLIYKSTYIPKVLGVLMALAGISWILISLRPYFFNEYNLSWMMFFSVGELVLVIWLLVKGTRIKESDLTT